jgi:hypothetical protein
LKLISVGGFVLDWSDLEQVNLTGTGDHLSVEPSDCSIFLASNPGKFKDEMPFFQKDDEIMFRCKISNTFSEKKAFFPKIDVRENFPEGRIMKSFNVPKIEINGEKIMN